MKPRGALASALMAVSHAAAALAQPASGVAFTTIALTGQPAPGTDGEFGSFDPPTLSESGEIAFSASLAGESDESFGPTGLWGPTGGQPLGLVALQGALAPGAGEEGFFVTLGGPALFDGGHLGFSGSFADSVGGQNPGRIGGIWAQLDGENPTLIVRETSPAPGGVPESPFYSLFDPLLDGAGRIAFRGSFAYPPGSRRDGAIWASTPAGLALLAREGDPAIGLPPATKFDDPLIPRGYTEAGELIFEAGLNPDERLIATDRGIYRADASGSMELVFRTGEGSPDLPPERYFTGFEGIRVNRHGALATVGLTWNGEPGEGSSGVFRAAPAGPLLAVAIEGEDAPGAPDGLVFDEFSSVQIGASGDVAFGARLRTAPAAGPIDAMFGPDGYGGVTLYLMEGDPAPGRPGGAVVASLSSFLAMNSEGHLLFEAGLEGPGIGPGNDHVFYFAAHAHGVIPIVGEGDVLEVAPGDQRTVAGLRALTRSTEGSSPIDDQGRVAFIAYFTDGSSGLFVASPPVSRIEVGIDVRPGSPWNLLRPRSSGWIPVAILGSESFDVLSVDVGTLSLGRDGAPPSHRRGARYTDVNRDGLLDLLARFRIRGSGVLPGDEKLCLWGSTFEGAWFTGCDGIVTWRPHRARPR